MFSQTSRDRRGFTMVELLMVILIIGILVSLGLVAYSSAMKSGRQAQVSAEINQLSTALEAFKGKYGAYPPSIRAMHPVSTTYLDQEDAKFMRFLTRMFPRYTPPPVSNDGVDSGTAATRDKLDVMYAIRMATSTNPADVDDLDGLNFRNLDPAESLVFWLGGMPHRIMRDGQPQMLHLLMFASDPASPFQHEENDVQRIQPFFDFAADRLVDNDGDGWPEYVPPGPTVTGHKAPYVYFEKSNYACDEDRIAAYPADPLTTAHLPTGDPTPKERSPSYASEWGYCRPYAQDAVSEVDPPDPTKASEWEVVWQQPDSFQLIAPGLVDGKYGPAQTDFAADGSTVLLTTFETPTALLAKPRIKLYPSGKIFPTAGYSGDATPYIQLHASEYDNQTNFTTGTIDSGLELE